VSTNARIAYQLFAFWFCGFAAAAHLTILVKIGPGGFHRAAVILLMLASFVISAIIGNSLFNQFRRQPEDEDGRAPEIV